MQYMGIGRAPLMLVMTLVSVLVVAAVPAAQAVEIGPVQVVPPIETHFSWFTLTPSSVLGGDQTTATVSIPGCPSDVPPDRCGSVSVTLSVPAHPADVEVPVSLPGPISVDRGTSKTFTIDTRPVFAQQALTISATYGTETTTATLTVLPAVVRSLTIAPTSMPGGAGNPSGGIATGTVSLTGSVARPPGRPFDSGPGLDVTLSTVGGGSAVTVPADVIVPGGATQATFQISTQPVSSPVTATVSAEPYARSKISADLLDQLHLDIASNTATLTVTPATLVPVVLFPPDLNSPPGNAIEVPSGATVAADVSFTGRLASNGSVALSSDNPALAPPPNVSVDAGTGGTQIQLATDNVSSSTKVTFTETYQGWDGPEVQTATLTLDPSPNAQPTSTALPGQPKLGFNGAPFFEYTDGTQINQPTAGTPFQLCANVVNGGSAKSNAATLNVAVSDDNGDNLPMLTASVPALNAHDGSTVCVTDSGVSADVTYDFNLQLVYDNQTVATTSASLNVSS